MVETYLSHNKFLNPYQEKRFLENVRKRSTSKEALMMLILYTYGMRGSELRGLRFRDLNSYGRTMHIRGTKGSRDRTFPVQPKIWKKLIKIKPPPDGNEDSLVFPISRFQLMRIWDEFKPCIGKTLHCLRHSAAIRLYQKHKDIQLVQNILGHRDLSTTLIYQRHVYDTDKYREVFNA